MPKYVNSKNGAVVETSGKLSGANWSEVKKKTKKKASKAEADVAKAKDGN